MQTNTIGRTRPRAGLAALLAALTLAGSLAFSLTAAAAETAPRPLMDMIKVENGTRSSLDGGDYLVVRVGDQAFGVVYGSEDHPNAAVTLFTVFTRSLGTATVTDEDSGKVIAENRSIPVRTLIAQRLDAAFEFRDLNGDGIFNFRPNTSTRDPFDIAASEFLVKGVDLRGDWNLTDFEMVEVSAGEVHISFALSMMDVPYKPLELTLGGRRVLDKVEFTVHVVVSRTRMHSEDIPHFNATVDRTDGRRVLTSLAPAGTVSGSWWSTRAVFKVDHDIVGWDFAPPREFVGSKLMLHTVLLYLNAIDVRLAPWLTESALANSRAGEAEIGAESGTADSTNATVTVSRPVAEFRPADSVGLRDHWHRVGRLVWVSDADVWANESSTDPQHARVRFQVLGGAAFALSYDGTLYRGFVLHGGFIYPAGYRIYHDPQLESASVELDASSQLPGLINALVLVGEVGLATAAALGVLFVAAKTSSKAARSRAVAEARRLEALKQRYTLPSADGGPKGES